MIATPPPPAPRLALMAENLARAGFRHGFSTAPLDFGARASSPSRDRIDADLADFARAVGFAPSQLRQVTQVHGARVIDGATLASASAREEADALVLRAGSTDAAAVGVRVADCVPVLVGARSSGAVAAIHAGWRGIVAGVIEAALDALGGGDRVAAIGPCIGPCCFEVGADVAEQIARAAGDAKVIARRDGNDGTSPAWPGRGPHQKAYVDLRRAVRAQLAALCVDDVEDVPGCTKCEPTRFFSHRRDAERSGRHLAAIVLRG